MADPNQPVEGSGPSSEETAAYRDFIRQIIDHDLETGTYGRRVSTRFPPEPNGYLHIGHAKSICLNFGIAAEYSGTCNLRFDDTNPTKEEQEYIDAIVEDVRWLGFDWADRRFHASDYFEAMYQWAERLIAKGKAYVCDLSAEQIREYRGTLTQPGRPSPWRERSAEESLALFRRMRAGEFPDGSRVLRAKIDMASPNLNMRDPVIYRILHVPHPHAGSKWCIYPMYDYAHPLEDAIETITHSICTLEFEDHRPLYDWFIDEVEVPEPQPRQIEFARLNLGYTVLSKRKLLQLVAEGHVTGWDDPRMPTISGLRRRGYTPEAIRAFCERIGVAKRDSLVDVTLLENALRDDLNSRAPRVMAVLRPLRVVIENYPEDRIEEIEAVNNPEDPAMGTRTVPFSREIYIEREDFREDPPKKFFRLSPGQAVRLRYAYIIRCTSVVKDEATGEILELRCTYDPDSLGLTGQGARDTQDARGAEAARQGADASGAGHAEKVPVHGMESKARPDALASAGGQRVKGTIHWVAATQSLEAEVRLYNHLFTKPIPGSEFSGGERGGAGKDPGPRAEPDRLVAALRGGDTASEEDRLYGAGAPDPGGEWKRDLNPLSVEVLRGCRVEPSLSGAEPGARWQFERQGYFCLDTKDSRPGRLVFNRTVTLRDTWAKIEKKLQGTPRHS